MHAIRLYRGVAIYRVQGSQNWYVRVWHRERQRYFVKTTGTSSPITARRVAEEHAVSLLQAEKIIAPEVAFRHFAIKCTAKMSVQVAGGERNSNYARVIRWAIQNDDWGLVKRFGPKDIRQLKAQDFRSYMDDLVTRRHIASSTQNHILAAFRNVMKIARDEGVIDRVPDTPRSKQRDNPRPFFRFYPLVAKHHDAYDKLITTAAAMAHENVVIRGVPVTDELCDVLLFLTQSFVRPITTELYAIRHNDITAARNAMTSMRRCDSEAMSALPPIADMCSATRDVRFVPIADIPPFTRSPRRPGRGVRAAR